MMKKSIDTTNEQELFDAAMEWLARPRSATSVSPEDQSFTINRNNDPTVIFVRLPASELCISVASDKLVAGKKFDLQSWFGLLWVCLMEDVYGAVGATHFTFSAAHGFLPTQGDYDIEPPVVATYLDSQRGGAFVPLKYLPPGIPHRRNS